jgi:hypothetical protein
MGEVCGTFRLRDVLKTSGDGLAEMFDRVRGFLEGVRSDLAKDGFEFGEELLNGVEIGTVCWEVNKKRATCFDRFSDTDALVNIDVVHEHDVTSFQRWSKNLFDIGNKHLAVHRPFEHEGSGNTIMTQRRDEGGGFPMAMQHLLDQTLAPWGSAVKPGDGGRDAGFINENEPFRIKSRLSPLQGFTTRGNVRPILFGGVQAFF